MCSWGKRSTSKRQPCQVWCGWNPNLQRRSICDFLLEVKYLKFVITMKVQSKTNEYFQIQTVWSPQHRLQVPDSWPCVERDLPDELVKSERFPGHQRGASRRRVELLARWKTPPEVEEDQRGERFQGLEAIHFRCGRRGIKVSQFFVFTNELSSDLFQFFIVLEMVNAINTN